MVEVSVGVEEEGLDDQFVAILVELVVLKLVVVAIGEDLVEVGRDRQVLELLAPLY
eukprot:CAMPEP_0170563522 /NCGR_PEP_ID=MMETSP0211-20121228/67190_1 /TAXON_ID=311385 /ORGANISM="Pseudokeronopsis sp., Strain OXSARD2" /LENGTH=55 /DNA_ID=CAMNT_0010881865 /DNA_START=92 /DNA_END=256 /DNA_ORIENTATION=+